MTFEVKNIEDWENVAKIILPKITHKIILLKGNLGTGKTTFTQFLLQQLNCKDEVNSPTYSIVNEYITPKGKVFHFDLYRINDIEELYDIGMDEYLERGFLSIIEWPEIYEEELSSIDFHEIKIENLSGKRTIEFS